MTADVTQTVGPEPDTVRTAFEEATVRVAAEPETRTVPAEPFAVEAR